MDWRRDDERVMGTLDRKSRPLLYAGGGEDPWSMIGALLGSPELARGDADAMKEVGRWRIEDEVGVPGRH